MILFALIILFGISFTIGMYIGVDSERKRLAQQFKYLDQRREQLTQREESLTTRERSIKQAERAKIGTGRDYLLQ